MANSSQIKNDQVASLYSTGTRVDIQFAPNGTGVPVLTPCPGVESVVRVSTGLYTVTLEEPWKHLVAAKVTSGFGSVTARRAVIKSHAVTAVPAVITIANVDNTGTVQDIALATDNAINLSLFLIDGAN